MLRRIVFGGCALLLVIGMVATISRTAFLAVAVMILVGLVVERRRLMRLWPLAIVLLIAAHTVLPGGMGRLYNSFFPKGGITGEQSVRAGGVGSGRLADLDPALKLVQANAFFGTGDPLPPPPDSWCRTRSTDDSTPPDPIIFDDQYLTSLVGHGVIGLGAVLWLVGLLVFRLIRASRRARGSLPMLSACTAAVAGFAAAMLTFDAFAFVQCSIFFFAIAALGLRLAHMTGFDPKPEPAPAAYAEPAALLTPAIVAARPGLERLLASLPLADRDVLAGLEVLVDLEEVLDLGEQLGPHVGGVRDRVQVGSSCGTQRIFSSCPASSCISSTPTGRHGTRQPGNVGEVTSRSASSGSPSSPSVSSRKP